MKRAADESKVHELHTDVEDYALSSCTVQVQGAAPKKSMYNLEILTSLD